MHLGRLRARTSSAEPIGVARLANHGLRFNKCGRDCSGKCNVIVQPGEHVYGVVYRLAPSQRIILDRAEGPGYARRSMIVNALDGGRAYRVFLYVAKAGSVDNAMRPYDWYRELVIRGAEQHGIPAAYVRGLLAIAVDPDPNRRRSRSRFNIM